MTFFNNIVYLFKIYPNNNFIITITIAPGIPSIPTKMDVIILSPIWKLKNEPIRFIINIVIPPSIEFTTNFNIVFIGTINIFPNINKNIMQAIYVIILLNSIPFPLFNTCPFNNITVWINLC